MKLKDLFKDSNPIQDAHLLTKNIYSLIRIEINILSLKSLLFRLNDLKLVNEAHRRLFKINGFNEHLFFCF
jgi:hypothetical protein